MANPKLKTAIDDTLGTADPKDDIDNLKTDLKTLSDDVKSLFASLGQVAKSETHKGVDKGKDYADQATDSLTEARTYVEGQVRKNPLASVGIAIGAGFLIAALRKK